MKVSESLQVHSGINSLRAPTALGDDASIASCHSAPAARNPTRFFKGDVQGNNVVVPTSAFVNVNARPNTVENIGNSGSTF